MPLTKTAQLALASLLAVATITTLRAALVSNWLILISQSVDDAEKQKNSRIAIDATIRFVHADAVLGNREIFVNRLDGHGSEIVVDGHAPILLTDLPKRELSATSQTRKP